MDIRGVRVVGVHDGGGCILKGCVEGAHVGWMFVEGVRIGGGRFFFMDRHYNGGGGECRSGGFQNKHIA